MQNRFSAIDVKQIVTIAGDGAISNPDLSNGALFPVLILNCESRPDLYDLIVMHQGMPPGDLISRWSFNIIHRKHLYLSLTFSRPIPGVALIPLEIEKYAMVIDGILQNHGVYLQPSNNGNSVSEGFGKPMILVEVSSSPPLDWNKLLRKTIVKRYKRDGLNRAEAVKAAEQHITHSRRIWNLRKNVPTGLSM